VSGLIMLATAFSQGMHTLLDASGSEQNIILLGAGSEESVERSEVPTATAGIAAASVWGLKEVLGVPAVSPEVHFNTFVTLADESRRQWMIRGVSHTALMVHPEVRVVEGRFPKAGEVMVGALAARKLGVDPSVLSIGSVISVDGVALTVAGKFEAPGTVMEAEAWAPLSDLLAIAQRDTLSCVVLRLGTEGGFEDAEIFTMQRLDLELAPMLESEYYARLSGFYAPIRAMSWLTAGLVAAGAVFGGLNTLHAAFASRIREMAALQAIGFSRPALFGSILTESLLGTLTGTFLAMTAGLLLADGIVIPFSIGAFRLEMTPAVLLSGLITGAGLGLVGTIPPSLSCLAPALRESLRSG